MDAARKKAVVISTAHSQPVAVTVETKQWHEYQVKLVRPECNLVRRGGWFVDTKGIPAQWRSAVVAQKPHIAGFTDCGNGNGFAVSPRRLDDWQCINFVGERQISRQRLALDKGCAVANVLRDTC